MSYIDGTGKIRELEQTIKALRERNAELEADWSILEIIKERDRALSELAEAREALLVLMGQADLSTVKDCSSQVAVMVALFQAYLSQQAKECEAERAAIPENGV